MPQKRSMVLDHFKAYPALEPVGGIFQVQSWILGAVLLFMFLDSLRMAILFVAELAGILLTPVSGHVFLQLCLGNEQLLAVCTTKFGNLRVMCLHMYFEGI